MPLDYPTPKATPLLAAGGPWKPPRLIADLPKKSRAVSPKAPQKGSSKKGKSLLITPEDSPDARSVIPPLAPVQPQTSVDLPHLFGKSPYNCFIWRVVPLKYASYSFPTNPGLLALSRSGYGGVFVVRSPMWESCCAMEILHIPTLRQYELSRTIQKLRVLRRIREDPQASRFVLQPSAGVGHSIWYSSHLYLHIVTDFCPRTFQDVRGHFSLNGNEPMLGTIIWELLDGLTYLHKLGIIHANLEPENVLISREGHCVIGGFGGSFTQDHGITKRPLRVSFGEHDFDTHNLIITPGFSAPELWSPKEGVYAFDETVDMWSLGLIICALIIPDIDHDVRIRPQADITVFQHYKVSNLTPHYMSKQMWIACCPNTVTEFVSMMCQLRSKDRPILDQAQEIAILNGWDKHVGAPFQEKFTPVPKPQPLPKPHRVIPAERMNTHLLKMETTFVLAGLELPKSDEGFIPNLDFKPFV